MTPPKWAITFGTLFMGTALLFAWQIPCPTATQQGILRMILSVAMAGFVSAIPGFFRIDFNQVLTIGGAIILFGVCYFINPARLVVFDSDCGWTRVEGIVEQNDMLVTGATVQLIELKRTTTTNPHGFFQFRFPSVEAQDIYSFRVSKSQWDTTIAISSNGDLENLRFELPYSDPLPHIGAKHFFDHHVHFGLDLGGIIGVAAIHAAHIDNANNLIIKFSYYLGNGKAWGKVRADGIYEGRYSTATSNGVFKVQFQSDGSAEGYSFRKNPAPSDNPGTFSIEHNF